MNLQSYQWIYRISLMFIAATVFLGTGALIHLFRAGNNIRHYSPISIKAVWPDIVPDKFVFDAAVFKKTVSDPDSAALHQRSASKRFRLAGTFFAFGINQHSRKAILDDLQKGEQLLVTEGDLIDLVPGAIDNATRVHAIMSDRIILRTGAIDEEIILCFAGHLPGSRQAAYAGASDGSWPSESRFGKAVGDKRWVLARSELMNYYQEVLSDTDRLARIYDSLKPVYEGQNIAGYTLVIEGEGDMFTAFGLQPGDVIRQVNSMPMTSQTRAEYFIGEFVKNRVNGFVLDIERAGRKEKLIYMIR